MRHEGEAPGQKGAAAPRGRLLHSSLTATAPGWLLSLPTFLPEKQQPPGVYDLLTKREQNWPTGLARRGPGALALRVLLPAGATCSPCASAGPCGSCRGAASPASPLGCLVALPLCSCCVHQFVPCCFFFFLTLYTVLLCFFFDRIQDCELRNQDFGLGRGSLVFSLCLLEGLTVVLWALVSQKSPVVRPGSRGQSPSPAASS